jgi:putative membrane-bound dehydrogenase-like protein
MKLLIAIALLTTLPSIALADHFIPRKQTHEPNAALTPQQAMEHMKLPPGFKVTLVASEPDIVNPTSFTFDDQGRIWLTESVEYPRESAGPGQDRIKVLESTKHDGHFDKVTVYKDGLNIPAGIAIGNGGVYVTNSPDILFLQGKDKCEKQEVILTGFGRADRHELPNSLTWGPDGWLYGMNGVFNGSRVVHDGKTFDFTCAIWRWHPKTKKFELFSQGTSNPWGLDYNRQGDWFISCCVIDHLFHMTESGYYTRQGGPYPPQTHPLPSITTGRHQLAAYGGLCLYDADQFPAEYHDRLFMGNLHGSAVNCDTLTRDGATYVQHNAPDFIETDDVWFMPVSEKIGPDGCLYIMDWYDKYHCYQDAGRDPQGVDRTRGRIYRISYGDAPPVPAFDLQSQSTEQLLKLLGHRNVWWRRQAQRVLNEKFNSSMVPELQHMALDDADSSPARMHALWLLVSQHAMEDDFHLKVLSSADASTRNWGIRAVGEMRTAAPAVYEKLKEMTRDPSPDVRVQVAIAAGRLEKPDGLPILLAMLHNPQNAQDPLIPTILYNNLREMIPQRGEQVIGAIEKDADIDAHFDDTVVKWVRDAVNAMNRSPAQIVASLKTSLTQNLDERKTRTALESVVDAFNTLGISPNEAAKLLDDSLRQQISAIAQKPGAGQQFATTIALWWNDPAAVAIARKIIADHTADAPLRSRFLQALGREKDPNNIESFAALAHDDSAPILIRQTALNALGAMNDPKAAALLADHFDQLPTDLKPMAINAMVLSKASAAVLLDAIKSNKINRSNFTQNHARAINDLNDPALTKEVANVWGTVRTERNPARAKLVAEYKKIYLDHGGDASKGSAVFAAKCAQCHTIYGKGGNIGPDLTGSGRDNLDLLLSNILDPSLVIGKPYYVYVAKLKDDSAVSGILAEDSPKQIVLKEPAGLHVVPRDQLVKLVQQNVSMMPEGLENTMTREEFCDLVAYLLKRQPPAKP